MSLDINLVVTQPVSIYSDNITHNLGKMASEVILGEVTLYDILWRPDEQGFHYASEIITYLEQALVILDKDSDRLRALNPANGWGSYDGLVRFVRDYLKACQFNPMAEISVCR
jgi:hypothetical protein